MTVNRSSEFTSAPSLSPLTRRAFIRATGVGLGAASLAPYLAGCKAGEQPDQAPRATGKIGIGQAATNTTFDPSQTSILSDVVVNRHIYQSLYRHSPFPPQTELTPDLAADLPQKINDTTYRIRLREGVTFHDGRPLTADDVVFSLQHYMNPDKESFLTRFFEPIFEDMKKISASEVEIRLNSPTTLLADRLGVLQIISKAAVADFPDVFTRKPVGSGPYQVVNVTPGETLTLKKNPRYSGVGKYNINEASYTSVKDANARVNGLYGGRFDVIEMPPLSAFQQIADRDNFHIEAVPSAFATYIFFNNSKPPFNDVRARQAVLYAIDRDTITKTSFFGLAEPVWGSVIRPENPDYVKPSIIYDYDPDRAKALMSKAGFSGRRIPVRIHAPDLDFLTSQLPVVQENLRAVGFEPTIQPGDQRSPADVGAEAFLLVSDPSVFSSDAEFILRWLYYGLLPRQFAFLNDETAKRFEQPLDRAYRAADEDHRKQVLAQVQNLIQELVPIAPLHRKKSVTAWNKRVSAFRAPATTGIYLDGASA